MSTTIAETPLQARLAACIGRLRLVEARALACRPEVRELIDELSHIYRDIGGHEAPPVAQNPASRHNLVVGNRTRHAVKQHDGQRRCPRHKDGDGAWLPISDFDVKNQRTGALRSWCRECTTAYQRERYVAVTAKTMTVELIEGDRCVGHDCPTCGLPFEIGERVQGESLHHEACAQ